MFDITGLNGNLSTSVQPTSTLCTLAKPKNKPGCELDGYIRLYVFSYQNMFSS